jgi:hypothetical protein
MTQTVKVQLVYVIFADGSRDLLHVREADWSAEQWLAHPLRRDALYALGVVQVHIDQRELMVH